MTPVRARTSTNDRILVVESDPATSDFVGRQALAGAGYPVQVAADAASAIIMAMQETPDLILVDITLPDLSGKDLLIALAAQGVQAPVIVFAQRGKEADLIQTFRLGAVDCLLLPAREAEIINTVNRALNHVHERREGERLSQQLQEANRELQARLREFSTAVAMGKGLASITGLPDLFEQLLERGVRITQADYAWFLYREEAARPFLLAAQHNLPPELGAGLNQPWDDGISTLVARSGETLAVHGEQLKRFKIAQLGLAVMILPVKTGKQVDGLLVLVRRLPTPFSAPEQRMLEALVDYAALALANARQLNVVEARAQALQRQAERALISAKVKNELLRQVGKETAAPLQSAQAALESLYRDPQVHWRAEQRQQWAAVHDSVAHSRAVIEAASRQPSSQTATEQGRVNLVEQVSSALYHCRPHAQRCGVQVSAELPTGTVSVIADAWLLAQVLDGALSNAIKFSGAGGQVTVRLKKTADGQAHLLVRNSGATLDPRMLEKVFEEKENPSQPSSRNSTRSGGMGIRLSLMREIILYHHGKIWLESQPEKGTALHILLPLDGK